MTNPGSPPCSVVIAARNEGDWLAATVGHLQATLPDGAEVVVLDDASTDGSVERLERSPGLRVIRPPARLGVAGARNAGARSSTGDIIVFCDGHVRPQADWWEPLAECLESPDVAAAGPVLTDTGNPSWRVAGLAFADIALNLRWLPVPAAGDACVPILCGCFMAVRRDVFERVGGFDPGMSYYGSEDVELCLRLWRLGYRCVVTRRAEVAHRFVHDADGGDDGPRLHNLLRMATIHLDPPVLDVVVRQSSYLPSFPAALAAVAAGDAGARHTMLDALAVRGSDEFLDHFGMAVFESAAPSHGVERSGLVTRSFAVTESETTEPSGTEYRGINRSAWSYWASVGSTSSQPVGDNDFAHARSWIDPYEWLPWERIQHVLCIGSAGGQQAPLLASLGCDVTLVDLSPDQLALDRAVAEQRGLALEIVEGDMLDLTPLAGRSFDLVFQPVSACYVPGVRPLYRGVFELLRPGGVYDIEHWNPTSMQLWRLGEWDGTAYRLVHPQGSGVPVRWNLADEVGADHAIHSVHFIHPLEELVGGLCDNGFEVVGFRERLHGDIDAAPGSEEHRAAYARPYLRILARRRLEGPDDGRT